MGVVRMAAKERKKGGGSVVLLSTHVKKHNVLCHGERTKIVQGS